MTKIQASTILKEHGLRYPTPLSWIEIPKFVYISYVPVRLTWNLRCYNIRKKLVLQSKSIARFDPNKRGRIKICKNTFKMILKNRVSQDCILTINFRIYKIPFRPHEHLLFPYYCLIVSRRINLTTVTNKN